MLVQHLYLSGMTDLPGVSVADPGFSPGGANSQSGYANLFFLVKKLHENERILAPRGAGVPGAPPLDSPLGVLVLPKICKIGWRARLLGECAGQIFLLLH